MDKQKPESKRSFNGGSIFVHSSKAIYSVWQEAAAMSFATYMRYLQASEGDATQSAEIICGSSLRTESRDHACRVLLTVTTHTSHKNPQLGIITSSA